MVEATLATPIPESPRPQQPEEESPAAAGELGDDERAGLTMDGSAVVPEAMMGTIRSLGAEARVASDAPESRVVKPMVPEGQTSLPEAS